MAGPVRVHFKLANNGKTHRFASILRDEPLFEAVTGKVASIVAETDYALFWNDDKSTVVLECASDLTTAVDYAVSTRKSANDIPCVHLNVVKRSSSEEEVVADVPVRSPEELLPKIKEHLRRLFDSALDEKWSSALRDAMTPLVCPETQNLLRPTERCAAEIAEQLILLEKKVPAELKEMLLQLPREDLKDVTQEWFFDDTFERAKARGLHQEGSTPFNGRAWSTDPARVACKDVIIALEMVLEKPSAYFCQDWEEDDEDLESEGDEEDFEDDWIGKKAAAILELAKQTFEDAQSNPVYPCPTTFLKKLEDGTVEAVSVDNNAPLIDRIARLRENLLSPPESHPHFLHSIHPTAMAHQEDILSVYYHGTTPYINESPRIDPDIAALLRRTLENVPEQILHQVQKMEAGDVAKVLLQDWIHRLVEERRAVGNVLQKDQEMNRTHCPADWLQALLYVAAAAQVYPAQLERAVTSTLNSYREAKIAAWTEDAKHNEMLRNGRRWFSLLFDEICDAVGKYLSPRKASHFANGYLPQPEEADFATRFDAAARDAGRAKRLQIIESLQIASEMRHYLSDSGKVHIELVELLRDYVRKSSEKRLERFHTTDSDWLSYRLLKLWFSRLDEQRLIAMRKQGNGDQQWLDFSPAKLSMIFFVDAAIWYSKPEELQDVLMHLKIRKSSSDGVSTAAAPAETNIPISPEIDALIQKHATAILEKGMANITPVLLSQPPGPGHPDYDDPEVAQLLQNVDLQHIQRLKQQSLDYPDSLEPHVVQALQMFDLQHLQQLQQRSIEQSMAAVNLNAPVEQPQPWSLPVVPQQQAMQPQQAPQTGYDTNGYGYQSGAPAPQHSIYTGAPVQNHNPQLYVQQQPTGNGYQTGYPGYHQYSSALTQYQISQQPSQVQGYYPGYTTPQQPVMQQPYQQTTNSSVYNQPYPIQQANYMPLTMCSASNTYNAFTM